MVKEDKTEREVDKTHQSVFVLPLSAISIISLNVTFHAAKVRNILETKKSFADYLHDFKKKRTFAKI